MSDEAPELPESTDKIEQGPARKPQSSARKPQSRRIRLLKTVLLRAFVLPAAIALSGALLVGGTPPQIRPHFLDEAHTSANEFIARYLQTVAGLPLFGGSGTSDYRRKGMCWVMVGVLADGSQKRVYESYPSCKYPKLRLFNRDFDTFLQRLTWLEYRKLQSPKRAQRQKVVAGLRRSRDLGKVSRYFCESPLEDNAHVENLYTVWRYSSISYKTGKVAPLDAVVHHYDCKGKRTRSHRTWPKIAFDDKNGVRLELP